MKVCMFVRNPIASDPRVRREAEHLARAGYDVTVIGLPAAGLPRSETVNGVRLLRVGRLLDGPIRLFRRVKPSPSARRARTSARPAGVPDAGPLFRLALRLSEWTYRRPWVRAGLSLDADVYHAHDFNTLWIAHRCARRRGAALVYDSHELWVDWQRATGGAPDNVARGWARLEGRLARRADRVITVSDGIAEELQRLYGIQRPLVVRNCPEIKPIVRSDKLRKLIGGDPARPILLYQGGFLPGRGIPEMIAAADRVAQADFVLMGHESAYKAEAVARAARARHRNVHVLPYVSVDRLWEFTCSAHVGLVLTQPVCLSYALSESNKLYEYLPAGLPVVASSIRSHRRVAGETGALALVDPYDGDDIARVVNELLAEPERIRQMGARGRHWAERKYNAAAEADKLLSAYAALAAGRPRAGR